MLFRCSVALLTGAGHRGEYAVGLTDHGAYGATMTRNRLGHKAVIACHIDPFTGEPGDRTTEGEV